MSAYKIEVSITPLCQSCGKECQSGSFMTESRAPEGVFDRDNPYERTDRRVFIGPCTDCFVFRGEVAELIDAATEIRTSLSLTRSNVMTEIKRGAKRWDGVPELLQTRIDAFDAALARVKGGAA